MKIFRFFAAIAALFAFMPDTQFLLKEIIDSAKSLAD